MRIIKFRAWDRTWKKMNQVSHLDLTRESGNFIIMEFTGLYDKHGREVYEGDVLRAYQYNEVYDAGAIGDVTFEEGAFRFNWKILLKKHGENEYRTPLSTICSSKGYNGNEREGGFDVAGNIYEHPELLKPTRKHKK